MEYNSHASVPAPLVTLRQHVTRLLSECPDGDLAALASGFVVDSCDENVKQMCPGFVESTFNYIVQHLKLSPQQLRMFRTRVSDILNTHLIEFMNTAYQAELTQLIEAVTFTQDPALLRQR